MLINTPILTSEDIEKQMVDDKKINLGKGDINYVWMWK